MDFEMVDTVKFEKAKAIARFNRFRTMAKMLQFFEASVALMLVSWSFTRVPVVVKFSGEFLVEIWVYVCNPHVVFVIGNAIIVALFVLCRRTDGGCDSVITSDFCGDENGEEISRGETQPPNVSSESSTPPPPQPEGAGDGGDETKQIVCADIAAQKPNCNEIPMATKKIEKFQRTQSEKLKRAILLKPQRELRRSETERHHRKAADSGETRAMPTVDTVETLSSEEFRLTIEKFIRKNQEFFKVESGRDEPPNNEYR